MWGVGFFPSIVRVCVVWLGVVFSGMGLLALCRVPGAFCLGAGLAVAVLFCGG